MARSNLVACAAIAALLSSAWFAAPAVAQNAIQGGNYTVQPGAIANAAREAATTTDPVAHPRFRVQLISFHANDETGVDALGADEIFAVFESGDYRAKTPEYGDINTDDTQRLSPRHNCVYPAVDPDRERNGRWRCDTGGAPGAINFTISLYETDGSTPWAWGACLHGGTTDLLPRNEDILCGTESQSRVFTFTRALTAQALATLLPAQNTFEDFTQEGDAYSITYRISCTTDLITQEERALER